MGFILAEALSSPAFAQGMMNLNWSLQADVVAVLHGLYAGYIVVALMFVFLGHFMRWKCVRNRWFRAIHLGMIAIVVAESWFGIVCPLTTLEITLRDWAGQGFDGTSTARFVHGFLFYDAPWWVFTTCYTTFGLLVVLAMVLVPPNWKPADG